MHAPNWKHLHEIIERIPNCGCGEPSLVYALIRDLLRIAVARGRGDFMTRKFDEVLGSHDEGGTQEALYWLALYVLDSAKLIEHGGNVSGSWASEDGKQLMEAWEHVHPSRLSQWSQMVFDRSLGQASEDWDAVDWATEDPEGSG